MTASGLASRTARATPSRSSRSTLDDSRSPGCCASPSTSCPDARRASITYRPVKPLCPVTRTRMGFASEGRIAFVPAQVGFDHHTAEGFEVRFRLPTEFLLRLGRVPDEQIDFCRTTELRVDLYQFLASLAAVAGLVLLASLPVDFDIDGGERKRYEVAHGFSAVGGEDEGVRLIDLQH